MSNLEKQFLAPNSAMDAIKGRRHPIRLEHFGRRAQPKATLLLKIGSL